ncbi:hypothetical protein ACICHK_03820 [Streptomyces sp. AHU1]|uniref:hypothetical protein n=1 Tax=Streptomyces sp. AHU1 TaxID=3377215 RepID=UPI003877C598
MLAAAGRVRGVTGQGSMPRARSAACRPALPPRRRWTVRAERGEQADAVDAVVARGLDLVGADAAQGLDGE